MRARRCHAAVVIGAVGAGMALLAGASAVACTNLAALNLSAPAAKPGATIIVTGSGFGGGMDTMAMDGMEGMVPMDHMAAMAGMAGMSAAPAPVQIRWNDPHGPPLTGAWPDPSGSFSIHVTVPDVPPGHYVLLATERNAQGVDSYGTPARAAFEVLGPSGVSLTQAAGSGATGGSDSSARLIGLTIALGAAGLGLFGAGVVVAGRQVSRRRVPAQARERA